MSIDKYQIPESAEVPSEKFNEHYSPIFEREGVSIYDIQNTSVTLVNKRHQTYPFFTYKGELILVGTKRNNHKALSEIKSKGFSLEKIEADPVMKALVARAIG